MSRLSAQGRIDAAAAALGLPALDDPTARAVLLVAVAHDYRDRDVWGGDRAITYWDRLPDRVRVACYAGPTLDHWWQSVTTQLGCTHPTLAEDRTAVAVALGAGADRTVLDVIRTRTEAVCLRVRLAVQHDRDQRTAAKATQTDKASTELEGQGAML